MVLSEGGGASNSIRRSPDPKKSTRPIDSLHESKKIYFTK